MNCAICDKQGEVHDLCENCEKAMTLVEYNPERLRRMARYLKYQRGKEIE